MTIIMKKATSGTINQTEVRPLEGMKVRALWSLVFRRDWGYLRNIPEENTEAQGRGTDWRIHNMDADYVISLELGPMNLTF
jgi:hypothetical protein